MLPDGRVDGDARSAPLSGGGELLGWAALCACALGMAVAARPSTAASFDRFFSGADPVLVVLGAGVVRVAALGWLRARHGFRIVRGRWALRGMAVACGLGVVMAGTIRLDLLF